MNLVPHLVGTPVEVGHAVQRQVQGGFAWDECPVGEPHIGCSLVVAVHEAAWSETDGAIGVEPGGRPHHVAMAKHLEGPAEKREEEPLAQHLYLNWRVTS